MIWLKLLLNESYQNFEAEHTVYAQLIGCHAHAYLASFEKAVFPAKDTPKQQISYKIIDNNLSFQCIN